MSTNSKPWYRKLLPDYFLVAIVLAAVVASLLPVRGAGVPIMDGLAVGLIAILFFLYGARLHPRQALEGLKHWRLHSLILAFTYIAFPLLGLALVVLQPHIIPKPLYLGLLFLCLAPSTVQSSVNFTSIAGGNVAGAVVSASASNLLGVFLTPLLVVLLMGTGGGLKIQPSSFLNIVVQILVPFIVGQLSRRWTADWVLRNKKALKFVDQGVIVVVVYNAFSAGMREHIWSLVSAWSLVILAIVCTLMVVVMLVATWFAAKALKFNRADAIAIQMCGSKKSLASGLPMASVLLAGTGVPVGLLVLPLMVFHQIQLMMCGALASHYATTAPAEPAPTT